MKSMSRFASLIMLITLMIALPAQAQENTAPAIDPDLEEQILFLEAWTESQRELALEERIALGFPTRSEVQDYIRTVYEEELTPELARRSTAFYVALGMLPAGVDLQQLFIDVMGSQVAGFYDPDTVTMNVIPVLGDDPGSSLSMTEQIIFVHEYVHALQDRAFDLDNFVGTDVLRDNPDQALASLSLVEGDATAVMNLYAQSAASANPLAALSILTEGFQAGNLLPPSDIPAPLLRELMFPYETGLNFVVAVFNSTRSWDAVDQAFANPPVTTEQVMHPEKYLQSEIGLPVDLVPLNLTLGNEWTLQWSTALGEYYLGEHLRAQLSRADALAAAAGWGGDHFEVYEHPEDGLAWALKVVWDTPEDAQEFTQAYEAWMEAYVSDTEGGEVQVGVDYTCAVAATAFCIHQMNNGHIITSAQLPALAHTLMDVQIRGGVD